jgi:hypothetical protein
MNKFKKGNEVTLVKDTFDDDINHRLSIQPQLITATKIQLNGQWVRTNHYNDWIHFSYFELIKNNEEITINVVVYNDNICTNCEC